MTAQPNPSEDKGPRVEFFRQSHNLANNLLGKPLANAEPTLFDDWLDRQLAADDSPVDVTVVGFDLAPPEQRAVEAVLRILAHAGYKERSISLTLGEWLDAYGVERHSTADGRKRQSDKERQQAIGALAACATKHGAIYFSRQNTDGTYNVMEHKGTLWTLTRGFEGLTKAEVKSVMSDEEPQPDLLSKIGTIVIQPNDIFFVTPETPYFYKPAHLWRSIQLAIGEGKKIAAHTYNFFTWLYSQASYRRNHWNHQNSQTMTLTVGFENLARQCRMEKELDASRNKRILEAFTKDAEAAIKMNLLASYDLSDRKRMTFTVNASVLFDNIEAFNAQQKSAFVASPKLLLAAPADLAEMLPSQLPKYIDDLQDKIGTLKARREFGYNATTGQSRALLKDNTRQEKKAIKELEARLAEAKFRYYGTDIPKR